MRFHTQGLTYQEALELSKELAAAGIDSNIVTGALAINAIGVGNDFSRWDNWDDSRKSAWVETVLDVVNDRCPLSTDTPLLQKLTLGH